MAAIAAATTHHGGPDLRIPPRFGRSTKRSNTTLAADPKIGTTRSTSPFSGSMAPPRNGTTAMVSSSPNQGWRKPSARPEMIQTGMASDAIAGTWPSSQNVAATVSRTTSQRARMREKPVARAGIARSDRRSVLVSVAERVAAVPDPGTRRVGPAFDPVGTAAGPPPGFFVRLALPIGPLALLLISGAQAIAARLPSREHTGAGACSRQLTAGATASPFGPDVFKRILRSRRSAQRSM